MQSNFLMIENQGCMRFKMFILILLFSLLSQNNVVAGDFHLNIYYHIDKFTLTTDDKNRITQIIDSLSPLGITEIEIIGHTDNSADSLYNVKLSNKRATNVRDFVVSIGINENIIQVGYYGYIKPIDSNESEATKRKNRRTELIIRYAETGNIPCQKGDTIIRTLNGKEVVFNGCEYEKIKDCIEIVETKSVTEMMKGIVIMSKTGNELYIYGLTKIELLNGCVDNECFEHPLKVRFPVKTKLQPDTRAWTLYKGKKQSLTIVQNNGKNYYEMEVKCPTNWIDCNCKKNQKH